MRVNQPVSQREYPFPRGFTLMSVTDEKGRIRLANDAFVAVSGFSREELIGNAHNVVRHPDMPAAAFADMWVTLRAGIPWTGIVKNRRADGDHYWVRANVTPVHREGRIVGYVSVRTEPSREEVARADELYKRIRDGAKGIGIQCGVMLRTGRWSWLSLHRTASVRLRAWVALALAVLPAAACLVAGGLPAIGAVTTGVALCAGTIMAAWLMERQALEPLRRIRAQAFLAAGGQACVLKEFDRTDDIGLILRAVNQAGVNQKALVDDVIAQIGGFHGASKEISRGNRELSARTEKQAASLEETAASLEKMAAAVQTTSANAREANALASSASEAATHGGGVVSQVTTKMEEISSASRKIAEILSVIDDIAFQTNILALNAAVEAARAGEQGRGFAVVAGEVRSLAQRSAIAAREIKSLILNSVQSVEAGSRSVQGAKESMEEIVSKVQRVAALIGDIATAVHQQDAGITQVNQAVTHLDLVTQQNAALVEQTTVATAGLTEQSQRLREAVSSFQFSEV